MAQGEVCGLRLFMRELPFLPGAEDYAAMGLVPEGCSRNKEGRLKAVRNPGAVSPVLLDMVFDPQTSGGLLAALPEAEAGPALTELREAGIEAAIVGESGGSPGEIELVP
jgi:selenide,water dikinase